MGRGAHITFIDLFCYQEMWGLVESFSAPQQRCCWWGLYGGTTYYWISSFLATESSNKHWEQREDFLSNKIVHRIVRIIYAFQGTNTTLAKLFLFTGGFKMKIWHRYLLMWTYLKHFSTIVMHDVLFFNTVLYIDIINI